MPMGRWIAITALAVAALAGSVRADPKIEKADRLFAEGRRCWGASANSLSFLVANAVFWVCGAFIQSAGNGRAAFGFAIGPGLRQMSVVSLSGRLIINNGYHSAVALAARGHTEIPVLLLQSAGSEA